jgi:hypothetical protein
MGLDQYWLVKATKTIHTHRKFNALQGFMEKEWEAAGNDDNFNCQEFYITEEILDRLEAAIKADELEPTEGFFYGNTEKNEWYFEDIKDLTETVIPDLRKRMENDENIYYSCWY